eukprot:1136471-Pelagomonas_calceolata.AAC.3
MHAQWRTCVVAIGSQSVRAQGSARGLRIARALESGSESVREWGSARGGGVGSARGWGSGHGDPQGSDCRSERSCRLVPTDLGHYDCKEQSNCMSSNMGVLGACFATVCKVKWIVELTALYSSIFTLLMTEQMPVFFLTRSVFLSSELIRKKTGICSVIRNLKARGVSIKEHAWTKPDCGKGNDNSSSLHTTAAFLPA